MFGSVSRCGGTICAVGSSDVDLVLVHPPGAEREAAGVRRGLAAAMHDAGLLADVTILSAVELVSSGFWAAEDVVGLEILIDCCGAPDGPIAHP